MVKEEAEAWAAQLAKIGIEGMVFNVIEIPGGWWVEQDCTEEWARSIHRRYSNENRTG